MAVNHDQDMMLSKNAGRVGLDAVSPKTPRKLINFTEEQIINDRKSHPGLRCFEEGSHVSRVQMHV